MHPELTAAIQKSDSLNYLDPSIIPVLRNHTDESIPYYLEILKRATPENAPDLIDTGLWNALFLMGENHIEEAFPHLLRVFHLDREAADCFGDLITESLKNILYHTYNGDLDLLCDLVQSQGTDYYVRGAALHTIQQLYLDGIISREKLVAFLKDEAQRLIKAEAEATHIACAIATLHLFELENELREIVDKELFEYIIMGNPLLVLYDAADPINNPCSDVVAMEDGLDYKHIVRIPANVADKCRNAQIAHLEKYLPDGGTLRPNERYEFIPPETPGDIQALQREEAERKKNRMKNNPLAKMIYSYAEQNSRPVHSEKPFIKPASEIGRNDPCPCGSGKKYKKCCLLKKNNT